MHIRDFGTMILTARFITVLTDTLEYYIVLNPVYKSVYVLRLVDMYFRTFDH